ncbi:MAG: dihydrodipicolinate synthase family protein, partial [Planctomycetota bacterium]
MNSTRVTGGLYVACVTPFDADEHLDLNAFRSIAEHLIAGGVDALIAAGTTGEAHALDIDERGALWRTAVSQAAGRVPVIAGTGATTTRAAKRFLELAAHCGCDAALVLTPWFETPGPDGLEAYYAELAESTDLPMIVYQNPGRTGLTLPHDVVARLADRFPGPIAGFKDAVPDADAAAALRERAPDGFLIFSGGPHERDRFGDVCDGSINDLANALPRESVEAYHGDREKARYLAPLSDHLADSANYIALLKAMMRKVGLPAGVPRRPHHLVPDEEIEVAKPLIAADGRLSAGAADEHGSPGATEDMVHVLESGLLERCVETDAPVETIAVCPAEEGGYQYGCHAAIAHADGRFVAAWSQGIINEDSTGQVVRYATSDDGRTWSEPKLVTPRPDGLLRWTCGGLWLAGDGLRCLAVRYSRARYIEGEATPGVCWEDLATESFRWTGGGWEPEGLLVDDIYANEAPRRLPDGRWMFTGVDRRHVPCVALSASGDDWERAAVAERTDTFRPTEPSWFVTDDGTIRMFLRDDAGSKRLWLTQSAD